jgi:hypothetical protein
MRVCTANRTSLNIGQCRARCWNGALFDIAVVTMSNIGHLERRLDIQDIYLQIFRDAEMISAQKATRCLKIAMNPPRARNIIEIISANRHNMSMLVIQRLGWATALTACIFEQRTSGQQSSGQGTVSCCCNQRERAPGVDPGSTC